MRLCVAGRAPINACLSQLMSGGHQKALPAFSSWGPPFIPSVSYEWIGQVRMNENIYIRTTMNYRSLN